MKIRPESSNAIVIELEDGTCFSLRETDIGNANQLNIHNALLGGKIDMDIRDDWGYWMTSGWAEPVVRIYESNR